jgi:dihydropteroate synthase
MSVHAYLRPAGRLTLPPGRVNATPDRVIRIGDRDDLAFTAFELILRQSGGWLDRRIISPPEASHLAAEASQQGRRLAAIARNLSSTRPPIAGLSLDKPRIMGIVNVTPDSFSDGAAFATAQQAIDHALRLDDEGADILDIGGESTRPGADPVPLDEELRRVLPVLEGLAGRARARLSIDTRKAEVMRRAAVAGVHMINDVSALSHDSQSLRIAADTRLPVVLMHAKGDPRSMQKDPRYENVLLDVYDELETRVDAAERAGIPRERILVDPGIGFGKTAQHNFELTAGLALLHGLGGSIVYGASRKSFIGRLTGAVDPAERLPGSIAAAMAAVMQGAQILRVHDVAATRQALSVWEAVTAGAAPTLV